MIHTYVLPMTFPQFEASDVDEEGSECGPNQNQEIRRVLHGDKVDELSAQGVADGDLPVNITTLLLLSLIVKRCNISF